MRHLKLVIWFPIQKSLDEPVRLHGFKSDPSLNNLGLIGTPAFGQNKLVISQK
jgi:hypothetical protein